MDIIWVALYFSKNTTTFVVYSGFGGPVIASINYHISFSLLTKSVPNVTDIKC